MSHPKIKWRRAIGCRRTKGNSQGLGFRGYQEKTVKIGDKGHGQKVMHLYSTEVNRETIRS